MKRARVGRADAYSTAGDDSASVFLPGPIDSASLEPVVRIPGHDGPASAVGRLELVEVGLFASSGIAQQ